MTRHQRNRLGRIRAMAKLLNHQVVDLADDQLCHRQLARAGYLHAIIWQDLDEAQVLARDMRADKADQLCLPTQGEAA